MVHNKSYNKNIKLTGGAFVTPNNEGLFELLSQLLRIILYLLSTFNLLHNITFQI